VLAAERAESNRVTPEQNDFTSLPECARHRSASLMRALPIRRPSGRPPQIGWAGLAGTRGTRTLPMKKAARGTKKPAKAWVQKAKRKSTRRKPIENLRWKPPASASGQGRSIA